MTYAINECNEDILIFGASRAQHHINPEIIEDTLHLKCFNFGSGGQNIFYHYSLFKSVIDRYNPKIVILEIAYIDCIDTPSSWDKDKLTIFYPYYQSNNNIKKAVDLIGRKEQYKMLSQIYPYNSLVYNIIYRYLRKDKSPDFMQKGFIPISGFWKTPIAEGNEYSNMSLHFSNEKLSYLKNMIDLCVTNNIQLAVTASPIYIDKKGISAVEVSRKMIEDAGFLFLNFEQDSSFINHKELFNDPLHLNANGAEKYSQIIGVILKNRLSLSNIQ